MNQLRDWEGRCQRCMVETDVYTMSLEDVALICIICAEDETKKENKEKNLLEVINDTID